MTRKTRAQEYMAAKVIEAYLGRGYEVVYDLGESGMTYFYYDGVRYKQVPNEEMSEEEIDVIKYEAPAELKYRFYLQDE